MMIDSKSIALSEDELVMKKQDVSDMINGLVIRSRRNEELAKKKGEKVQKFGIVYRKLLVTSKAVLYFTPDKAVEMVWSDIMKFFNVLIIRNKMAQEVDKVSNGEMKVSPMQITFRTLIEDVKNGNW